MLNLNLVTKRQQLFTSWLEGLNKKVKSQILVGASIIIWALWLILFLVRMKYHFIYRLSSRGLIRSSINSYLRRKRIALDQFGLQNY
jgi:hypothetical protein